MPISIPLDPWGRPYIYLYTGTHGDKPDVFSYGADWKPSGHGNNAKAASWLRAVPLRR